MKVIDLFSGCGGFSTGFIQAGFKIIKAVEFDSEIAGSYSYNHADVKMIVDDIKNVDQSNEFSLGEADIIIGGPPCQGFSMAGARIRNEFIDDPRNYLFKHYYNIVREVRPKAFVMENVKGIMTMKDGKIFKEIIKLFESIDSESGDSYSIYHFIVNATAYGVPQSRERVIIIGLLNKHIDLKSEIRATRNQIMESDPHYFDSYTVWDAISNLGNPTIDGVIMAPKPENEYQQYLSGINDCITNHVMTKHSKKAIERMNQIKCGENFTKLDEKINSVHSGSYGRLCKNKPSPTITTRFDTPSGGMFIHPEQNRTITPREAARIQSFPDSYIFKGSKSCICKQIGNAVPPKVAYFLAMMLERVVNEKSGGEIIKHQFQERLEISKTRD